MRALRCMTDEDYKRCGINGKNGLEMNENQMTITITV